SVEMHNNVFYREGGGGVTLVRDSDASWVNGPAISGAGNWIAQGSDAVPASWSGTVTGVDPGFRDLGALDLRPAKGSALIGHSANALSSPSGHVFPSPLSAPLFVPPMRRLEVAGSAAARPAVTDIGAYEINSLLGGITSAVAPSEGADGAAVDGDP